ncbi:MAG: bifunctional oligoribonuclease/PAP phosphatase NrnA [Flavobacteriales bacterium]|mgnify:FL=1|nr:bifunctional oligoribonuclease/PAP phosphatase NrnA [Flavobacteriales bacterium]MBT7750230.1 bifunctional oligoribonuclease/PAP phosphatase NrnA [Flavobacteriales bacterium]
MDYNIVRKLFESPKKIVITAHRSPDADAIGSSLSLSHVLTKVGHHCDVVIPDAFPSFLDWMSGASQIMVFDSSEQEAAAKIKEADLIFCLDYNRLDRIAAVGDLVRNATAPKILIDHHIDPDTFDYMLSDTNASSTAELVFDFVSNLDWVDRIDADVAACMYAGMMTDTGSFKYPSTTAHTHRVAAELMDRGLKPTHVHQEIFDNNSFSRLQLIGYALTNKLEFNETNGVSIISLSVDEKSRFNFKKGDTEGLVNYGLSIGGARMAVFLSEEPAYTKMSLRSKGDLDVNVIAREHFNGGGHKNAAGGKLDLDISAAVNKVKDVLESLDN